MNRSGFLVWKDLVDKFLARTPQRMAAVGLELQNIEFQPGTSKETIPQFFARLRAISIKYKGVGGIVNEETRAHRG